VVVSAAVLWVSVLSFAAPSPGTAVERAAEIGPFRLVQRSELTWPGVYIPDFELSQERRWVHRFSLGVVSSKFPVVLETVVAEPPDSAGAVSRSGLSPRGAAVSHIWTAASLRLPSAGGPRSLSVGRLWILGSDGPLQSVANSAAKVVFTGRM